MRSTIIEKVMKLPKKDKINLYYALQEELDFDDDYLSENDLTPAQWAELNKRIRDIDTGKTKLIPWKEFKKKIDGYSKKFRSKTRTKHTG